MKKIYMILAAISLLTLSLNAQLLPYKTAGKNDVYLDKGKPASTAGLFRAPAKINTADGEFLVGPYTTDYFSTTGKGLYSTTGSGRVEVSTRIPRADIAQYLGQEIVGYRFATVGGTVSCYSFLIEGEGSNSWVDDLFSWNIQSDGTYYDLSGNQWHEFYLDEPVVFQIPDTTSYIWIGYKYFQESSNNGSYTMTPIAVNPNVTNYDCYAYGYANQEFYDVTSTLGGAVAAQLILKAPSSDPKITASPTSVSMSAAPGSSATETVTVTGANLTNGITATISGTDVALFSVSPASLGTSGGTLTITYSPTAAGNHTATLTLTSTGADPVTITLNGTCSSDVTICNGTDNDSYLPIYGLYNDEFQVNQMIYPKELLTDLVGKTLTSMTFYATANLGANLGTSVWTVKLGTTTQTAFASALSSITRLVPDDVTAVIEGYSITTGINTMTINFTTPFTYNGGNLLVDFQSTDDGGWVSTSFYGVNQSSYTGYYSYNSSSTVGSNGHYSAGGPRQFLPKVTFTYESSTPPTPTPELTAPTNGSTVNVGINEGSGVSTTITVSGENLTEDLTVSVSGTGFSVSPSSISAADANAGTTITVTYNGTDPNATGTLTISSGEVSTTVNLTASYVPVIPTVAITPATQTINDAAAGALTVTGTDVTGNINVSAGSDWSLSPTSLSSTGGQVSVSYTGRALSANTTVTASATGATDATATVNYVADLYIVTDNGVTDQWDFNNGTHMTYDPNTGTYTATFTANADNTYILFARMLGNDVNWNTRYVFGPASDGNWWMTGESASGTIDVNDDDPIYFQNAGTYTITINSDGTFTITTGSTPQVPVLITPEDGSTVFVGTTSAELPTVSKEIPISGQYLTRDLTATISGEGFSFLTRDIAVPYADVNAATASVIVTYSGTDENATGTLTLSSDEVSAVVNLTASYIKPIILTTTPAGYVAQGSKVPDEITTAIIETFVDRFHGDVVSVTYVNSLGMTSDQPFDGVNIVVTRYSDGTTSTSKVIR